MALPISKALAIKAMGISARDSKAQWGQVTEILSMGSGISFPFAWIHLADYRRRMGRWVDKEMQRSLQLSLTEEWGVSRRHPRDSGRSGRDRYRKRAATGGLCSGRLQQVPKVAVQILEHRNHAVALRLRIAHEDDAARLIGRVVAPEIIGVQE
jgi:hypothetical protein